MGIPLPGSSPSSFQKIFDEAIVSSTALANSINTNPDFWLKNLKALQQAYGELTTTNTNLTTEVTSLNSQLAVLQTIIHTLEGVDELLLAARGRSKNEL